MKALKQTNLSFPTQTGFYKGKVRDVYFFDKSMAIVASDRISAFDHILPEPIPFKGQVLNLIAEHFLNASKDIVPNWLEKVPHPNVSIGKKCEPIKLEMVVRGYLAGHAWRCYSSGQKELCGVIMPDGMKEADKFPHPIITPATKAEEGHDEDISEKEILSKNIVSENIWKQLCEYSLALFDLGTKMAAKQGLILVDTKYEFGFYENKVYLIDEIHTPDSSRYYHLDGYDERQKAGTKQVQLSKEFVREWLMKNGFQGKEGQLMPDMPQEFVQEISDKYISLYEKITGKTFSIMNSNNLENQIFETINNELS